jgi:2-iminobutanoate/2-iminopropanoate deaminase
MGVGDFFMKHMVILTLIFLTFGLCANQSDRLVMPSTEENNYPFSDAVKVGNLLFMSGMVGSDETIGDLVIETHDIFKQMKAVLAAYDLSFADVVKCTVFLDDVGEWGKFNSVYTQYFKKPYPARSALGADGLALGASLELECIAEFK